MGKLREQLENTQLLSYPERAHEPPPNPGKTLSLADLWFLVGKMETITLATSQDAAESAGCQDVKFSAWHTGDAFRASLPQLLKPISHNFALNYKLPFSVCVFY